MSPPRKRSTAKQLIAVLNAGLKQLKLADADESLVEAYQCVIEYVKQVGHRSIFADRLAPKKSADPQYSEAELRQLSIEQVEKLLQDQDSPRSFLEQVAIQRFGVPKGSMRKWGSKESLREKIETMMRNERLHRTIGEVARRDQVHG